jgi:hypothetical protein
MKLVSTFVAVALLTVVGASKLQAQSNPVVGTWKLNVEKSKFDPGPGPKSMTRTIVADGDGFKYTHEGTGADGKPIAFSFKMKFDEKNYPVTGTMPSGADSVSFKKVDANHYEATPKKGGKAIGMTKVSISADGKVTTVDSTGTNAAGAKTHDVQVYDKQ